MLRIKYIWFVIGAVILSSCEQGKYDREIEPPVDVVSGDADFSKMVSLGASFVSGVSDGTVFINSQENSFPNIMAKQMELAGGGEFVQPLVDDNIGGLLLNGDVYTGPRLYFNGAAPVPVEGTPSTEITNVISGPFNNMGVPGAKSFHLVAPGYGNVAGVELGLANPYFARMASGPNVTVLEDAASQFPSFFVISEIAGNDVLGYATSGGTGVDQTGNFDPSTYGPNDITDPNVFAQVLNTVVETMTAGGAKGVIGNIPAVTSLPYFTTVPHDPLDPNTIPEYAEQIPLLNAAYAQLNQAFVAIGYPDRQVFFSEDEPSPVVIHDESLQNISPLLKGALLFGGVTEPTATILSAQYAQSRQANENDLLVLTSSGAISSINEEYFTFLTGLGVPPELAGQLSVNGLTFPLEDKWVLLPSEQEAVMNATDAYNQAITAVATQKGLGFVDAKGLLEQLSNGGVSSNGFILTGDYVTGGAFSLDGIHLNARGYAFLANEFLKAIDETYGSNFEDAGALVDIGKYPAFYGPILP
ncbi:SGNH/GDSL hydrolase family protein [Lutimonas zeaxanthinifaciens]|uniref:SGNH/GDSL hydrolase family protein n=1 Tax=Lutimonas zeaxanthinifaciens TaxID=3060215 RepID=UPI00265D5589|nr:G-D-S-L family lipolytic protein [Lutimonas sp. YSD2104]WKK65493.1 G-D-S-L family lipolytic protein [Lutimonas sp. YSD2104]